MNTEKISPQKLSDRACAQRERILDAAQKCFVSHGFHAAGMALIAETANMSPGLIYRYFDSKSTIILAIIERQGKGLPLKLARLRAITLQCFMEGLAVRALREPDLDPAALKAAIAHFLDGLFAN